MPFHHLLPRTISLTPASSRALAPVSRDSRTGAPKASDHGRTPSASKSPAHKLKSATLPASWEPITIEDSAEDGSERGAEVAPTTEDASIGRVEIVPATKASSKGGAEVIPTTEDTSRGIAEVVPIAPRPKKVVASCGVAIREAAGKRAPPTEVPPAVKPPKGLASLNCLWLLSLLLRKGCSLWSRCPLLLTTSFSMLQRSLRGLRRPPLLSCCGRRCLVGFLMFHIRASLLSPAI